MDGEEIVAEGLGYLLCGGSWNCLLAFIDSMGDSMEIYSSGHSDWYFLSFLLTRVIEVRVKDSFVRSAIRGLQETIVIYTGWDCDAEIM